MSLPSLDPKALEGRLRQRRINAIVDAMKDAPIGYDLSTWVAMSEEAVQRRYAECIEPLLKAAEEGEKAWMASSG